MRKRLAVSLVAASLFAIALPAAAKVNIFLDFAPPAAPVEVVPPPRIGFVWVPGYYDHDHGRYKWVAGRWEHERKGYAYHGATWEHRSGHWYYTEPGWRREHSPG